MRSTVVRLGVALLLLVAAAMGADVRWYYTVQGTPKDLPGVSATANTGVLVLVRKPAESAKVFVEFVTTGDRAIRRVTKEVKFASDGYPFVSVPFDLGPANGWVVLSISVKVGDSKKWVAEPVPGVEY